ncbi:hypothetical protein BWZ20_02140 [Winogradskyella sp. J14-2]|uniref:HipA family kinase n=1 Tax=Winogradskyella sp. J14-2 TaxID=1936080 RepID=UPI00097267DD|nr:HipA family kinase [Winogradskyella sp. J14-2]APY07175.1 hypothetical protein BWZ20_02140 [Winogradskyella sp. J14-2]
MNIKELKLVAIRKEQIGGSTRPLIIDAEDEDSNISSYVLKLYNKKSITQNFAVAKEILILELAKEFDLPVPDYGIINFDHKYLTSYFDEKYIENLDSGYKFCSKIVDGVVIFNPLVKNTYLQDYDIENVFAFDNLILNIDRGGYHNKPNLLVNDEDFVLIDHELTLPFYSHPQSSNINYWNTFMTYNCNNHIFLKFLKKMKKTELIFDEFQIHLDNLNLTIFDDIFDNFDKFNINNSGKNACLDYFKWAKLNNVKIVRLLNNRIS